MRWLVPILSLLVTVPLAAQETAADVAQRLRAGGLDAEECYRVRDLMLLKEDARLYFTEGFLIFGKPVDGKRFSAIFSGEVDGGDGEILVMPPMRSERLSLATFTKSPNLNEHFRFALMIFSDDTANELLEAIRKQPAERRSPERGVLLADRFGSVVNNLISSFGSRLVYDVLSERPNSDGFFYAAIRGIQHGNFDFVYDPVSHEQIQLGQVNFRQERAFFDVWTSFPSRDFRNDVRKPVESGFRLKDYRIVATLGPNLELTANTEATLEVKPGAPRRVFYFDISSDMTVSEVAINDEPCEIWQRDSLRANLFGGDAGLFLVVAAQPLAPGEHRIRFQHAGRVVSDAGNGVYFVGSRNSWYPFLGLDFSHFDMTFNYPLELDLVFPGELVEDRTEGECRITRRKTENPVRLIGFNVGKYVHLKTDRQGFTVEVYANTTVEQALEPHSRIVLMPRVGTPMNRRAPNMADLVAVPTAPSRPDPTARLERLATEVADAFEFMKEHFGDPPASTLRVSPIPGSFGQGFPGLLYVSTLSYLEPEERPEETRNSYHEYFYSEILHAHETAHQWWGNALTTEGYQDGWLMEALANYSAMLLLEERKGPEALSTVLDQYRGHLLFKNEDGKTLESAGPITWGPRLNSSHSRAFQVITYEKGSWIQHMLRRRLGDENYLRMLGDLFREHRYLVLTTEDFRRHAARYVPENLPDRTLENFFDHWVYDAGIPELTFKHRIRGSGSQYRVTGTVTQSGVADYFSVLVPLDIHLPGGKSVRHWIRTSEEAASFDIAVAARPVKVEFNAGDSVLALP